MAQDKHKAIHQLGIRAWRAMPRRLALAFLMVCAIPAMAQDAPTVDANPPAVKAGKAFAMSIVLPGWGQQYVNGGSWKGLPTLFAGVDAAMWLGFANASWRHNHAEESFRTLAATGANADVAGKDRTFFLNLATHLSSDAYLTAQLRNRAFDQLSYVDDPSFQWEWESEDDFFRYRELRDDAETFKRRRTLTIATLVANRLISGISAVVGATRANNAGDTQLSLRFTPPVGHQPYPTAHLKVQF